MEPSRKKHWKTKTLSILALGLLLGLLPAGNLLAFSRSGYFIYKDGPLQDYTESSVAAISAIDGGHSLTLSNTTTPAYGIYWSASDALNNNENLTVSTSWDASSPYSSTEAYGVFSDGEDVSMTNSGNINLSATGGTTDGTIEYSQAVATARGISGRGDIYNTGAINITATGGSSADEAARATIYGGIQCTSDTATVTNYGAINLTATGGNGQDTTAHASGIIAEGSVNNYTSISVTATGGTVTINDDYTYSNATAAGVFAGGSLTNEGNINVTAREGSNSNGRLHNSGAIAIGLYSAGETIASSGNITASAIGTTALSATEYLSIRGGYPFPLSDADAFGIIAYSSSVYNSGAISVTADNLADGTTSSAYGIYMYGNDLTLSNFGSIIAAADQACEVYIESGSSVSLLDTYTMTLDGDPATGAIYIGNGATLRLNGATLSLISTDSTIWNSEYRIFDIAEGSSDFAAGTVDGSFGSISAVNPNVTISYNNQGTADTGDDTVSAAYQAQGSTAEASAKLMLRSLNLATEQVNQRLTAGFLQNFLAERSSQRKRLLYADSGMVMNDASPKPRQEKGFFFVPYYSHQRQEADPIGYSSDSIGFVSGLDRITSRSRYGFHLGYAHSNLDYTGSGYADNGEGQDLFSAGLHLIKRSGLLTWRGQLTGFYGHHDYSGLTGASLEMAETADYDSYGINANLMAGYLLHRNGQVLLPEIGLNYQWLHQDSFTTDADHSSWDATSSRINDGQLAAQADLRWLLHKQHNDIILTPSVAVGMRYLLTDNEISIRQSVDGAAASSVTSETDTLTGTLGTALQIDRGRQSLELAYNGEYGESFAQSSLWLRFSHKY